MTAASDLGRTTLVSARAPFLWGFRLIPRIETYPEGVSFSQTIIGKLMLLGIFYGIGTFFDSLRKFFLPLLW